jgi:hypothetical protein
MLMLKQARPMRPSPVRMSSHSKWDPSSSVASTEASSVEVDGADSVTGRGELVP